MNPLAHSAKGEMPAQPYADHVSGVTAGAESRLERMAPYIGAERLEAYRGVLLQAAQYHDLGKLSAENQAVLREPDSGRRLPVAHRDAGTAYLLGERRECPAATLIHAHHPPGLPNLMEEKLKAAPFRFLQAVPDTEKHLAEYAEQHHRLCSRAPEGPGESPRLSAMEYRMLLSCMTDADYTDAGRERLDAADPRWGEWLQRLDEYVAGLGAGASDERNETRRLLYESCKRASTDAPLTYCDSPVGTGKTTALMAYHLKTALARGLRHIFIVVPYTSIITQTVDVLREAFALEGEERYRIVAEHHHQADFENAGLRHLATTWAAPVIVTTAVQFFETLAGNRPAKLRKLHQLPGSAILIDESHAALPVRLMAPAWKWLSDLARLWGCSVCLSSGTNVRFWEYEAFQRAAKSSVTPLLPERVSAGLEAFERQRIRLSAWEGAVPHFTGLLQLVQWLDAYHGSRVIVLNTVRSAASLANFLRESGRDVLHLSTALTPGDREAVIEEVQRRLRDSPESEDWTLVATSCIECGMDFSFHHGFCELRSLQSYLQLGGRVRRGGESHGFDGSELTAFTITEDSFGRNPAFDASRRIFQKMIASRELPSLSTTQAVTKAFVEECKQMGELPQDLLHAERTRAFADVAEKFRVIEEDTVTVAADQALAQKILAGVPVLRRELQRGSVNIRQSIAAKLKLPDTVLPVLGEDQYDHFLGYMKTLL